VVTAVPQPREAAILAGDRRAIARAISAIEQGETGARAIAVAVAPHLGRAHVLGITGAPGAGKSTLINALLGALLARGQRIAVVAVDPSSPITGGAVLGDRVRMGEHGAHEKVFIRSLASRGHLGGMSRTTGEIVDVLDAAGFDTVIVETVGAGQSEVEITRLADTRLVVCPPGLGDNVQAIKAGILEIADILVVSKGDLPAAEVTVRDLEEMLRLRRTGMTPVKVLKTAATRGEGIAAVVEAVIAHAERAGRGRRFKVQAIPSPDDIAAVERAITTRRSVRAFLPTPVPRATIEAILTVARRAPSGTNTQPWHVHVLAGERKRALSDAVLRAHREEQDAHAEEHLYYPVEWYEPYLGRRRRIGWDLYGLLGIDRGDKTGMHRQHGRNYLFFGAPIGLIFTIDRNLERGSWLDYGMFLQNVMVAARARGLDTCAQASFLKFHRVIERELSLEANESVICAMSLGHADPDAPENRLVTDRAPVTAFARFVGFDESEPQSIEPDREAIGKSRPGASTPGAATRR
jgi:LAO/AO transport system ATPase